jgi:hypothetical protein
MHVDEYCPYANVFIPAANSVMFISSRICSKHEAGNKPTKKRNVTKGNLEPQKGKHTRTVDQRNLETQQHSNVKQRNASTFSERAQSARETLNENESLYERKRRERKEENETMLNMLFAKSDTDTSSSTQSLPTGLGEDMQSKQSVRVLTTPRPSVQSPTRRQWKCQHQEIRVLLAGELNSSNPTSPDTHYVHFPLHSLEVTSLMAWLGTTILNGIVGS